MKPDAVIKSIALSAVDPRSFARVVWYGERSRVCCWLAEERSIEPVRLYGEGVGPSLSFILNEAAAPSHTPLAYGRKGCQHVIPTYSGPYFSQPAGNPTKEYGRGFVLLREDHTTDEPSIECLTTQIFN